MILRVCVCIPIFDNPKTIEKVVIDTLTGTEFPVLVVDDGSVIPVTELLAAEVCRIALLSGRLRVVRLPLNLGKGAAIKTAFQDCVERGFTHLLTMDGDGQHFASEIPKLVNEARANPWDLIIGNRRFAETKDVPKVSKFGRKFSNFWVNFETGTRIKDSQSGFRLYPLFQLQTMKLWTRRYDFEIEILIRLLWRGVGIREVEIEVYYPEPGERVSHFDKFWDNARISMLNTLLVTISLLKMPHSPRAKGLALGVGVFIGCTPFYGIQTFIAMGVALLFRMNAPLIIVGTQISIPPLAPFLMVASLSIGQQLHSLWGYGPGNHFLNWLAGSSVLGASLGFLVGGVAYITAYRFHQKTEKKSNWNGRTRGGVVGNGILKLIMRHLGIQPAYLCLYFVVPYFYIFAPKGRRSADEYWSLVRPEAGFLRRQLLILRQYFVFAQITMDGVYQSFHGVPKFQAKSEGREYIARGEDTRQGTIMLGAHVGGWGLAASLLKVFGVRSSVHKVQYESAGLTIEKLKAKENAVHLMQSAASGNKPALQIRELLAQGQPVAIMGDRPVGNQFELVKFFGKLAPFDVTPFRIAAACDCQLLFTYGFKGAGNFYNFYAKAPRTYSFSESVTANTPKELLLYRWVQEFAQDLEGMLRQYPEQWSNFYPFWSSLPVPPEGPAEGKEVSKARNYLLEELRKPATSPAVSEPAPKSSVETIPP